MNGGEQLTKLARCTGHALILRVRVLNPSYLHLRRLTEEKLPISYCAGCDSMLKQAGLQTVPAAFSAASSLEEVCSQCSEA